MILPSSLTTQKPFDATGDAPIERGSSFDLTIGQIVSSSGQDAGATHVLKPNEMVLVVSRQIFDVPSTMTGLVTYKTSMTQKGIWALTVGLVDPGWNGPVATTLLNFSKVDALIQKGDPFLRVVFFAHAPVQSEFFRRTDSIENYLKLMHRLAVEKFPSTFLDNEVFQKQVTIRVAAEILNRGAAYAAAAAAAFAAISFAVQAVDRVFLMGGASTVAHQEVAELQEKIATLTAEMEEVKKSQIVNKQAPTEPVKSVKPN